MYLTSASPTWIAAERLTTLPPHLHYRGEPTEWTRATRPGQNLVAFLEGVLVGADGRLWLVDVPHGRIFTIDPDGTWQVALQYAGEPHSLVVLGDGTLLIADYRLGLLKLPPGSAEPVEFVRGVNTERFRGLGDMVQAPNGDIWLSDPGRSSLSDPTGRLYRLRSGAQAVELVLDNVPYPNGIALSPNGRFVYLSATRANAVWRLLAEFSDPFRPMAGVHIQLSGGLGPDGLAMRGDGLLAVAHGQAGRSILFNALGDPVAVVTTPGGTWTTSVAYSADGQHLYIVDAETSSLFRALVGHLKA